MSTSMYASYCVMKLAHENNTKVLLDGQVSDEILCGYRKARVYYIRRLLSAKKRVEPFGKSSMICLICARG